MDTTCDIRGLLNYARKLLSALPQQAQETCCRTAPMQLSVWASMRSARLSVATGQATSRLYLLTPYIRHDFPGCLLTSQRYHQIFQGKGCHGMFAIMLLDCCAVKPHSHMLLCQAFVAFLLCVCTVNIALCLLRCHRSLYYMKASTLMSHVSCWCRFTCSSFT